MARDRDNPPVELISLKLELIDRLECKICTLCR